MQALQTRNLTGTVPRRAGKLFLAANTAKRPEQYQISSLWDATKQSAGTLTVTNYFR